METPGQVPTEHTAALTGTLIANRYAVRELLGRGGTCEVYRARDTLVDVVVALKRVRPDFARQQDYRQRLIKEARRGRIADPRIAAIYEVVDSGDELMLVMEYVEGTTLRMHLQSDTGGIDFWRIATECAEALKAAHDAGLVHRDIKPDNVMVMPDGGIKLLDFGLAHRMEGPEINPEMSTASLVVPAGTPRYMAPEAYRGGELDARTDIFALGVMYYEMLCGAPPFNAQSWSELNDEILHLKPPAPGRRHGVSGRLSRLVMRMIEKDPADRVASCQELLAALAHARRGDWPMRRYRNAALALLLLPALFFGPAVSRSVIDRFNPELPPQRNLVLLPLTYVDGDAEARALARGLHELLLEDLSLIRHPDGFSVAAASGKIRDARAADGANLALSGELVDEAGMTRVRLALHATDHRESVLQSHSFSVGSREYLELARQLIGNARTLIDAGEADPGSWNRVHGRRSDGAFGLLLRGIGWQHAGTDTLNFAHAVDVLEAACNVDAGYAAARAELALTLLTGPPERIAEARSQAEQAIALDPQLPQAWLALAKAQMAEGKNSAAIDTYSDLIALGTAPLSAWLDLARLHESRGNLDAEAQVLDAAIIAWPGWSEPYYRRAFHRWLEGDFLSTLEDFRLCTSLAPQRVSAWSAYGGLLVMHGSYEAGIDACSRSIAIAPDEVAYSNLATAYYMQRRFDLAIDTYHDALEDEFDLYTIWMSLGDAYQAIGDGRARDAYLTAITRALADVAEGENSPVVQADLARMYAGTGQPQHARWALEHALAAAPDLGDVLYSCALAAWQLDDRKRALELLGRALETGWPRTWIRDSANLDSWRKAPEFASITGDQT